MEFTGSGLGYFRIWIVNVVLTVLSLGFYSPWATIRKLKYFTENTRLDGDRLEFRSPAMPLFWGRFILLLILGSWFLVTLFPWVAAIVAAGVLAIPYLLVRRYRYYWGGLSLGGVPFDFRGSVGGSYQVYLSLLLISVFTVFLGGAWGWFWHRRFLLENTWHGEDRLQFRGTAWGFVRGYLPAFLTALLSVILWVGLVYMVGPEKMEEFRVWPWLLLYSLPFYLVFLFCMASIQARTGNYLWNHVVLGERRICADFETGELFGIYVQNSFLLLISAGLAWPWAKVNLLRYRAERVDAFLEDLE